MADVEAPADDLRITTAGLFVEAHAGFIGRLERLLLQNSHLSVQWFEVLMRLFRTPGHRLRMSDLAAQTTLTPSGLTRAVDRLESEGLVQRDACPSDRRGAYAVLTEAGAERIGAAVPHHVDALRGIFDEIYSPEELDTLTELLRRLRDEVNPEAVLASTARLCNDVADAARDLASGR